jgi:hypothetical protein
MAALEASLAAVRGEEAEEPPAKPKKRARAAADGDGRKPAKRTAKAKR